MGDGEKKGKKKINKKDGVRGWWGKKERKIIIIIINNVIIKFKFENQNYVPNTIFFFKL